MMKITLTLKIRITDSACHVPSAWYITWGRWKAILCVNCSYYKELGNTEKVGWGEECSWFKMLLSKKDGNDNPTCKTEKETQMYRTDLWTLWEKARVGGFERTASKHVYYLGWNRSPAQVGCVRQVLGPGALGRPRGIGWRGRWEGGSGWGIHVNPWLIHVSVWQKPLQYCKVISLQLIKINGKKIKRFCHHEYYVDESATNFRFCQLVTQQLHGWVSIETWIHSHFLYGCLDLKVKSSLMKSRRSRDTEACTQHIAL